MSEQPLEWRGLSKTIMALFMNPPNAGTLPQADGEGWSGTKESGRFMRIQVKLEEGRVAQARFGTHGCAPAIAAGAYATGWAEGRTAPEIEQLTAMDVIRGLGGIPVRRRYCADMAVEALQRAVRLASEKQVSP